MLTSLLGTFHVTRIDLAKAYESKLICFSEMELSSKPNKLICSQYNHSTHPPPITNYICYLLYLSFLFLSQIFTIMITHMDILNRQLGLEMNIEYIIIEIHIKYLIILK